ncbi:MAG: thiol reductant ABC exporter subunit CydC, partial [Chloroflexi bacterium RBG_19FT_COMBO_49_13]
DVSYGYSNQRPALKGVSFEIPAGKMTAIVGESGAGKTTLTWLLLRFLQPQSGEIIVDGKLLSDIPVDIWLNNLAWVPQNPYLFNDTIAANIKLACPNAADTAVQHAARLAHVDEFINQLPQGYATQIGEGGTRLSAGQAQRIALARAFLKDAGLLILDEATSHLDPETDALLQDSLATLCRNRTVVVIAHHRSTLTRADKVIELSHGQVAQSQEFKVLTTPIQEFKHAPIIQQSPQNQAIISDQRLEHKEHEYDHHQPSSKLSIERRLVKLLSPFTGRILLSIFLGFATIASSIGLMATAAYIISAAALHPSIAELQVAIVGVRFFGLSRGVFRYLERLVSHDVTFRLLARWRVWFYQALEPLAPARLLQYHSGDLLSRVISDIGSLETFYVRTLTPPLVAIMVAMGMGGFMSAFGSDLAWGLIGFLFLAGFVLPLLVLSLSHQLGPQMIQARAHLSTVMIDGIQGLPDLLAFGQAGAQIKRVDQIGDRLIRLQARMASLSAVQTALGGLVANLCMLTILALAIQKVAQGQLAGVLLGTVALGALMSFEAVQTLPLAAQNFETNRTAAGRLYELVDAKATVNDPTEPLPLLSNNHLEVNHLSFQYPPWGEGAHPQSSFGFGLENISFSLQPGKHIAIVGRSGAGKTTLINLLQRFWEYQQGSIHWGGNELRLYRQEDIQKRIGAISQNTYCFSA